MKTSFKTPSTIRITNSKHGACTVDIEGTIGVPEEWQFEDPAGRVATYESFRRSLADLSRIENPEVVVNIRSSGGDVGDALLIHDALCSLGGTVTTRSWGYVASAATVIAQAASPGRRELSASALYLIHNSVAECEGNACDFDRNRELLSKTDERLAAIYAERSGRPASEFAALMAENNGSGRWLSPAEALAAGLVDRIMEGEQSPDTDRARKRKAKSLPRNLTETGTAPDGDVLHFRDNVHLGRLRHRTTTIESDSAQLAARPTEIKAIEDPSPTDTRRTPNEDAYKKDAESFYYSKE